MGIPARALRGFAFVVCLLAVCMTATASVPIIRNGDFTQDLASWRIAPGISNWSPIYTWSDGGKCLALEFPDGRGTVLSQSLNLTAVAGAEVTVSADVRPMWYSSDGNVSFSLVYLDSAGTQHSIEALTTAGAAIASEDWTPLSGACTIPSDAVKVVAIRIAVTASTYYYADNIALAVPGATVGAVPAITGVSPASGPYGTEITVTGTNLGGTSAVLNINGSSDGVNIISSSETQIHATINDPASTGPVSVVDEGVVSDGDAAFKVTSPSYSVRLVQPEQTVIRGQVADFLIRVDSVYDYTSPGITFSSPDAPSGAVSVASEPLHNRGGALMSIDTTGIEPGTYNWHLEADDSTLQPRYANYTLNVCTISSLTWKSTTDWTDVTEVTTNKQGLVPVDCQGVRSDGKSLDSSCVSITSSDPSKLMVYHSPYGNWNCFACANGTATLTAVAPDGTTASLVVNIDFPTDTSVTSVGCSPQSISNNGIDEMTFTATAGTPSLYGNWYDCSLDIISQDWTSDGLSFTAHATAESCSPGTYLYGYGLSYDAPFLPALFTITNDPTTGEILGRAYSLEEGGKEGYENVSGTIEFYNETGDLAFSRDAWSYGPSKGFDIANVPPGTYRLRFVPGGMPTIAGTVSAYGSRYKPQWYSNAESFETATPVVVSAGGTLTGVYFYIRNAPLCVEWTKPETDAPCASPSGAITVEFSKWLWMPSVSDSVLIVTDAAGNRVSGNVSGDGRSLYFYSDNPPQPGMTYTATITTDLQADDGTTLDGDYTWSFTVSDNKIASLDHLKPGDRISLSGKTLYWVSGSVGYIEEPNRVRGIRVEGIPEGIAADQRVVLITGTVESNDAGERYIAIGDDFSVDGASQVAPLGACNRSLKLRMCDGLLIRGWGAVKSIDDGFYTISDGSDAAGIRVYGNCPVGIGEFTAVTGAAGWEEGRVIHAFADSQGSHTSAIRWRPTACLRTPFRDYHSPLDRGYGG